MGSIKLLQINRLRGSFNGSAVNIRRRLLVFLLVFVFVMIAGVIFLLAVFGGLPFGSADTEKLFLNELDHLSTSVSTQYGAASVQAVRLSERLTANITLFLRQEGFSRDSLKARPELLNSLLAEQVSVLMINLDATDCSGVFVALDATVNPSLPGAEYSKAGLYIRAIEPNIAGTGTKMRYLLRGPSSLTGDGILNLQAKWDLEFHIEDQSFWQKPLAAYEANPSLPLSRLVSWCSMSPVQGLNEDVMVCSVPLLDENGSVLGVCGFEISQMNFTLRHGPRMGEFHKAVFIFCPAGESGILLEEALFAGDVAEYDAFPGHGLMSSKGGAGNLTVYIMPGGAHFTGVNRTIRLSPDDSPFAGQAYQAVLIIPKGDFDAVQNALRIRFGIILFALAAMGIPASIFISRQSLNPVMSALNAIRSGNLDGVKTNIVELDQLIEQVKKLHANDRPFPDDFFEDFEKRVRMLTPVETTIFRYYLKGTAANEIMSGMFITKSALKTHNERIYTKLGVSGENTFLLYIELIKMSGHIDKFV